MARHCGTAALAEWALAELEATGARPRPLTAGGVGALTASERRARSRLALELKRGSEVSAASLEDEHRTAKHRDFEG